MHTKLLFHVESFKSFSRWGKPLANFCNFAFLHISFSLAQCSVYKLVLTIMTRIIGLLSFVLVVICSCFRIPQFSPWHFLLSPIQSHRFRLQWSSHFELIWRTFVKHSTDLGTGQYLWEYGTGKWATGPPFIFTLRSNGATGYFEASDYGATGYFNAVFQRGQRLFLSTSIRGHRFLPVFMLKSHS